MSVEDVHVCWTIDCEATQEAISDLELGVRAIRGFVELLTDSGLRGTLFVLPADAVGYPVLLRELESQGLEIGLHYHPQEEGHQDYCGAYSEIEQMVMYSEATTRFAEAVGFRPKTFRTGSCSANDSTFPVTEELGFTSCSHSMPGRNMADLRANWVGAPAHPHFAHAANRLLPGTMNLVEVPITTDPDSMLWSGTHAQDLRVELFDAKNHRFMIDKMLRRERTRSEPVKAIVTLTHNIFDYGDPTEFRAQTMKQMIRDFAELADRHGVNLIPSTLGEIADAHRAASGTGRLDGSE